MPPGARRISVVLALGLVFTVLPALWMASAPDAAPENTPTQDESPPPERSLDRLFEALRTADSADQAQRIERSIWAVWLRYDGGQPEVRGMMRRGHIAVGHRRYDMAEAAFDAVVALAPDYAEGWNRRATARFLRGDLIGSIADIRTTLALEPRHFAALSGLGLIYMSLEEDALALAAFEAALAIHPFMAVPNAHIRVLRQRLDGRPI